MRMNHVSFHHRCQASLYTLKIPDDIREFSAVKFFFAVYFHCIRM